jgi:predicted phosphodiesterase
VRTVRLAVLADIHANAPALRAVLGELDGEHVDGIVVAGDVVGGPLVRQTLELMSARPEPLHWLAGNCERETLAVYDGAPVSDDPPGRAAAWSARGLDEEWRAALGVWPISLALDGVRFCHGSPRRDDEILTRVTAPEALAEALSGTAERLVVGGHTHQQMVRDLRRRRQAPPTNLILSGPHTYANAGSVGMPYEGRPGAFWMIVENGTASPRATTYDLDAAVAELRRSGFPDLDDMLTESQLDPVDPDWVAAYFEHGAGRGPEPGEPRRAGG